jgi:hypothetical protein
LVATFTLQPVPQKRQGAFCHFNSVCAASVTIFVADTVVEIPAEAAAVATALRFMNSLLDIGIIIISSS